MQMTKDLVLGIDTSNYTTSVSLTDRAQNPIEDRRVLLRVKQGERGLRQSNALFQHQENLPKLLHEILPAYRDRIAAVSVSSRPRPVEGSYMPVFLAGCQTGRILSDAFGVPYLEFSHQEGHLKAASFQSSLRWKEPYLAWHLSGGTCELLLVSPDGITILGGSLDISFGQLLDRLGVAMKLQFPCGAQLDRMALDLADGNETRKGKGCRLCKPIARKGLEFNLSGLETQALRLLEREDISREAIVLQIFEDMTDCLYRITAEAAERTGASQALFTGGVSASRFLRQRWKAKEASSFRSGFVTVFGDPRYSPDNAVGTSLLGGESLWG